MLTKIDWTKPLVHSKGRSGRYIGVQEQNDEGRPTGDFKHLVLIGTSFNYYDEYGRVNAGKNGLMKNLHNVEEKVEQKPAATQPSLFGSDSTLVLAEELREFRHEMADQAGDIKRLIFAPQGGDREVLAVQRRRHEERHARAERRPAARRAGDEGPKGGGR